jgi:hypothetical protein
MTRILDKRLEAELLGETLEARRQDAERKREIVGEASSRSRICTE